MNTNIIREPDTESPWLDGSLLSSVSTPNTTPKPSPNEDEALKWLTLLQCPQLGIATLSKLSTYLPSLLDVYDLKSLGVLDQKDKSRAGSTLALESENTAQIKRPLLSEKQQSFLANYRSVAAGQLEYLRENNIHLISIESDEYPTHLKQTSRPPIMLFGKGNIELLQSPQIAFVGSRTPTAYGSQVTRHLVEELVHNGFSITSGLALGIDAISHQATVNAVTAGLAGASHNTGTIAVMGSGHQHLYPKRHARLAQQIEESNGLILSEFLPNEKPQQYNFPRRNRVIAGLSLGTVVVEAATRSGSLITAQHAIEEGRDVFAVPGNIFNAVSAGCHELIQQGAKLITCAADILEDYSEVIKNPPQVVKKVLAESNLLANVDYDTTPVDVISQRSNLPMEKVLIELLDLEIQGLVAAVPGGYCRVATNSNNK